MVAELLLHGPVHVLETERETERECRETDCKTTHWFTIFMKEAESSTCHCSMQHYQQAMFLTLVTADKMTALVSTFTITSDGNLLTVSYSSRVLKYNSEDLEYSITLVSSYFADSKCSVLTDW